MGVRELIKQKLVAYQVKKYEAKLTGRKITYDQWIAQEAKNSGSVVCKVQDGKFSGEGMWEDPQILLLQVGAGTLAAGAEAEIKAFFAQHPEVVIIYGDEDVCDPSTGKRTDPWFKPDWSPDTFLSSFYLGSVVAVRREWLKKIGRLEERGDRAEGKEKPDRELAEKVWELVMEAGGFERGCKAIGHISRILFHGVSRAQQQEISAWGMETGRPAGASGADYNSLADSSLISIIIPSKDHPDILFQGLRALFETKGDYKCEVIVVDNGSCEENRLQIEQFLLKSPIPCKYLYQPMEFNFSRMCNLGAREAEGELLLFLNDDVEAACSGWLGQMAGKALLPYVGAVGLKLLYPGGKQIQHVGIMNLPEGPIHKLQFMTDDRNYYDFNKLDRNVLAVTGACFMVHREKYRQAGGMNEKLRVTFNDVDLCFHLWELGYHNVVINSTYAYHHESLSRGEDSSLEKFNRLMEEQERLYGLHPELKGYDSYYSTWLNRDVWDTAVRPVYVTAGNCMQEAAFQEITVDLHQYRRDDCLLLAMQRCEQQCIQGYSVVLGDNNACYDRRLILWKLEEPNTPEAEMKEQQVHEKKAIQAPEKKETQAPEAYEPRGKIRCLSVTLEGQYRPDLEENMADQVNVALCGFWVKPDRIPAGAYRVGILAHSRVSGIRLVNWSRTVFLTEQKGWSKHDRSRL